MNLHSDEKEHILKKIKKGKHNLPIACMDGGEINQNQLSNYDNYLKNYGIIMIFSK